MSMLYAVLLATVTTSAAAPPATQEEFVNRNPAGLIATLQSNASLKEKADACRHLAIIGGKEAVPVLAGLLADEKLAHMARYALEPIPDPSVDEAFRGALGKLKGPRLVGVVCSIGVRRDAKAVPLMVPLLADRDCDVAQAAARALGRVGTAEAAKALQDALAKAPAGNELALCEGLFRCASTLASQGRQADAISIYELLRHRSGPHQVRSGAICALILARGKDGLPLLAEELRGPDAIGFAAAVRASQQIPSSEVTGVLASAVSQLPDDRRIPVIQALARRRDPSALPALAAQSKAASKPVRLAAIRGLGELGQALALPALAESLHDGDRDLAQAARESLAVLPGAEIDAAVMAMFGGADAKGRLVALELIGRRGLAAAIPGMLKAAGQSDPQIRAAALQRLGQLGGSAELTALIEMLLACNESQDLGLIEQAIGAIVARLDRPESYSGRLAALLPKAAPPQKAALLRLLTAIGGPGALETVRASANNADREVQTAAIRALAAWKTPDVLPVLLAVTREAASPTHKMLALRAYLGWAGRADLPADQRLAICRQAAQLAQRTDEKRLLLSALGNADSADALGLIVPYLTAADTKDEAAAAVVSAAERLLKKPDAARLAPQLIEPLQKVAQTSVPPAVAQRAKAALKQAESKARKK